MEISREDLERKIISVLRTNNEQWYTRGHLVQRFEFKGQNERQILSMRIHRALNTMYVTGILERRQLENYEYKWKVK